MLLFKKIGLEFATVKKGFEDGLLLLIDVRNPKERDKSGHLTLKVYHTMFLNISVLIVNCST